LMNINHKLNLEQKNVVFVIIQYVKLAFSIKIINKNVLVVFMEILRGVIINVLKYHVYTLEDLNELNNTFYILFVY